MVWLPVRLAYSVAAYFEATLYTFWDRNISGEKRDRIFTKKFVVGLCYFWVSLQMHCTVLASATCIALDKHLARTSIGRSGKEGGKAFLN